MGRDWTGGNRSLRSRGRRHQYRLSFRRENSRRGPRRSVVLWDMVRRQQIGERSLSVKEGHGSSLAFSPDGQTLAVGAVGMVELWDVSRPGLMTQRVVNIHEDYSVTSVAFTGDGRIIATVCGGHLELWDVASGQQSAELSNPETESVESMAISPDGKILAAGLELDNGAVRDPLGHSGSQAACRPAVGRHRGPRDRLCLQPRRQNAGRRLWR